MVEIFLVFISYPMKIIELIVLIIATRRGQSIINKRIFIFIEIIYN